MSAKFINDLPHTEFGASLCLSEEQEQNCKVVYRLSEKNPERYVFDSLWNPDAVYPDNCIIVPLRSVAAEKVSRDEGYIFSNIINSTGDPRPEGKSWLDVFTRHGITCDSCATDGKFYKPHTDPETAFTRADTPKDLSCNNDSMKGGHVFAGEDNMEFQSADYETVELIPICAHHNSYTLGNRHGNGAGFYMKLKEKRDIIQLTGYLNKADVE